MWFHVQLPLAPLLRNLDSADTRCVLVLPQIKQHFAETLFARSASTTPGALAGDINQLGNTLPAGTTCGGILPVGKELLSIGARLTAKLVGLVVVGNVEVVNVLAGLLDCCFLLLVRNLCTAGNVCVSSLAPLSIAVKTVRLGPGPEDNIRAPGIFAYLTGSGSSSGSW